VSARAQPGRSRATSLFEATPGVRLEYVVTGSGPPTTVFAHGLAGSIAETRPLGSGVHGSRVFFHFRGHGRSAPSLSAWSYTALAAELRGIADHVGATRAVGVSLGAGALSNLIIDAPRRFHKLVFFLPAVLDQPRPDAAVARIAEMAALVDARDVQGLAGILVADQPAGVRNRGDVRVWADGRARTLAGTTVSSALREMSAEVAIADVRPLAAVVAPALVIAQQGDVAHPVRVAERLAGALGNAKLHVFDADGALWTHRRKLRALVAGFLND
jgi:pimeloyl-ACP methyl ester carboxylesterase